MKKIISVGWWWVAAAVLLYAVNGGGVPGGGNAPFPTDKLSVLIIRESQARLNNDQFAVVNGPLLRTAPQFRIYDPDQNADKDAAWVKPALEAIRASEIKPPVLGVSNGKSGAIVPLPANEAELQALLTKYGG